MEGSVTQTIKDKLSVAEVLKSYIELQPAGRNFKARCPFHNEKTPSFIVSPDRGSWHCFGCNEGGDIFTFLMKFENLEFGEALKILAERAGVELRRVSPMEYKQFGLLYDLQAAAKDFFIKQLSEVPAAGQYLLKRGLTKETIGIFELGFAPNATDALTRYLINLGFAPEDVIRAGLAAKSDRGLMFDRFRGRIMFPIENHSGKVVAFTGRILPELDPSTSSGQATGGFAIAKYLNSPETPIFQKSRILYNFHRAKGAIREADMAFLVEGQMDVLMTWQTGVKYVVASSGTALTADHLAALRRLTEKVVLSFDSDEAGLNAIERAIDLAEAADFGVKVAVTQGAKDPADLAQEDPAAIARMIAAAEPAPKFYFDRYLDARGDLRDRDYLTKVRKVALKLGHIASPVERSTWMKELADRAGLSEQALAEEAARAAAEEAKPAETFKSAGQPAAAIAPRNLSRYELLAEDLLGAALAKGDFTLTNDVVPYLPETYLTALRSLAKGDRRDLDPDLDALLNFITLRSRDMSEGEIAGIKAGLRMEYLRMKRHSLTTAVRDAERGNDEAARDAALKELSELPNI